VRGWTARKQRVNDRLWQAKPSQAKPSQAKLV
jgi:hypothetical protein